MPKISDFRAFLRRNAIYMLLIAVAMGCIFRYTPDHDVYHHLTLGRYIVENHAIPKTNPFVIHDGFKMVTQEVGSGLFVYLFYTLFGRLGLYAVGLVNYAIAALGAIALSRQFTESKDKAVLIGLLLATATATTGRISIRPFGLDICLICCMLAVARKSEATRDWTLMLKFAPVISIVMAMFHTSMWLFIVCAYCLVFVPRRIDDLDELKADIAKNKDYWLKVIAVFFLVIATGFVNPNGLDGVLFLFRAYGVANSLPIAELQTTHLTYPDGILYIALVVVFSHYIMTAIFRKEKRFELPEFLLAICLMGVGGMCSRNIIFAVIGMVPIVTMMFPDELSEKLHNGILLDMGNHKRLEVFVADYAAPTALVGVIACIIWMYSSGYGGINEFEASDSYDEPLGAVAYLDEYAESHGGNKDSVRLFNEFNTGSFLQYHGYKTYFNPQPELYAKAINGKEDVYLEYIDLRNGKLDYQEFIDKYEFTHILVETNTTCSVWLDLTDGYEKVWSSDDFVLFERR